MSDVILDVQELGVYFYRQGILPGRGTVNRAVDGVNFRLDDGEALGIAGESGCGKTTTALSLVRLLPSNGRIRSGKVELFGIDLVPKTETQLTRYRWREIAIVFQGAMNALNPVVRIGDQIREAILLHGLMDRDAAEKRVAELLELVGIPRTRRSQYPHEYSGGMRQRAMIAMALACSPDLLFADEPTTALDVMIQAQVLELLRKIQKTLGLAIILVTHDLGVVAEVCDSVVVMYGGMVAEWGSADAIYNHAQHPYTRRLLASFPNIRATKEHLASIPGTPPRLTELPIGCRFWPRCDNKVTQCSRLYPPFTEPSRGHYVACHLCPGKAAHFR